MKSGGFVSPTRLARVPAPPYYSAQPQLASTSLNTETWLKNCWQVAAFSHELTEQPLARTFLDERVVLFRTSSGGPAALADRCPHRFAPLSRGKVIDGVVQCPYHGMRFDGSGTCVAIPGQDSIPPGAKAR